MNILSAAINWFKGYGNYPELEIVVDSIPERNELRYQTHIDPSGTSYFAELGDYIDFFHHNPRNPTGFGGAVFNGILTNGEPFSVRGPWSSNSEWMNQWFTRSNSVTITSKSLGYKLAGHIREDKVIEVIKSLGYDIAYLSGYGGVELPAPTGTHVIGIKHPNMTWEESQKFKNK